MDNQTFDEALRRVVADEKLPDAPDAWARMATRLDAHNAGKKRWHVVLPLPVIRWAAAAAVVAAALAAGWWLRDASTRTSSNAPQITRVDGTNTSMTKPSTASALTKETESPQPNANTPAHSASNQTTGFASSRNAPLRQSKHTASIAIAQTPQQPVLRQNAVAPTPPVPSPSTPTPSTQPEITPAPQRPSMPNIAFFPNDADAPKTARGTGFDLAGGYGFGGDVPAFSVGVAVKQKLTRRLQLEGALALVGNTPDPFVAGNKSEDAVAAFDVPTEPGIAGQLSQQALAAQQAVAAEAEYEDLRTRQLFVQAAPVLMYRVVGDLSAGGGVDAQRRVSSNSSSRETYLNSFAGATLPALPEWDFGLALRADYSVTKRLRFGLQYRESLRATSATGAKAAGRDYWLLQAGYRIR